MFEEKKYIIYKDEDKFRPILFPIDEKHSDYDKRIELYKTMELHSAGAVLVEGEKVKIFWHGSESLSIPGSIRDKEIIEEYLKQQKANQL